MIATKNIIEKILTQNATRFDSAEGFYDQISSLHKSVRSDPDAASYWFCRMLTEGLS